MNTPYAAGNKLCKANLLTGVGGYHGYTRFYSTTLKKKVSYSLLQDLSHTKGSRR